MDIASPGGHKATPQQGPFSFSPVLETLYWAHDQSPQKGPQVTAGLLPKHHK